MTHGFTALELMHLTLLLITHRRIRMLRKSAALLPRFTGLAQGQNSVAAQRLLDSFQPLETASNTWSDSPSCSTFLRGISVFFLKPLKLLVTETGLSILMLS